MRRTCRDPLVPLGANLLCALVGWACNCHIETCGWWVHCGTFSMVWRYRSIVLLRHFLKIRMLSGSILYMRIFLTPLSRRDRKLTSSGLKLVDSPSTWTMSLMADVISMLRIWCHLLLWQIADSRFFQWNNGVKDPWRGDAAPTPNRLGDGIFCHGWWILLCHHFLHREEEAD